MTLYILFLPSTHIPCECWRGRTSLAFPARRSRKKAVEDVDSMFSVRQDISIILVRYLNPHGPPVKV